MGEPSVAAIVVNWNGREYIEPCLATLLASTYSRLSVTLVDNASSDGSLEYVGETFPSVRVIENETNLGYAAGVNVGVRAAFEDGADFALLLNNDIEIAPDAVGKLVEAATGAPDAAFVGPKIYYHEPPDVIWSMGGRVSYWTGDIRHVGIRERDGGQYEDVRTVDYVTGCAVLASVPALREIGPMDETYYMYNEDTDWCVRASRAGYRVLVEPRAKVWHKVSMSSGGGLTPFKTYNRLRSTFRFFGLYARPYQWVTIVPATAGRALAFAVREVLSGRTGNAAAVVRGAYDSARGARRT